LKITNVEVWQEDYQLVEPYTIAYETFTKAPQVFVRIENNKGISGYGCASPDLFVTGETTTQIFNVLKKHGDEVLIGKDPFIINRHRYSMQKNMKDFPGARAAVEMALYDMLGKHCHLPVWRLLGGYRKSIKTCMTIGIKPLDETIAAVNDKVKEGFLALKIKGGADVEEDIEKIMKVREAVGPKIEIRFDANQGYDVNETMHFVQATQKANLSIIEQPVGKMRHEDLVTLTKHSEVPIMADETLIGLMDAFKIARNGLADMVNIKLMKCGGITEATQINAVARSAGLSAMVGCMDELALGISAGLHFALAHRNVNIADLDSHLEIIGDPTAAAVIFRDGHLFPSAKPGFGYDP